MTDQPKHSKPLPVRISPELLERIDAARGLIPRETYVRHLLGLALAQVEAGDAEPGR
jgi:hypothetical protein